MRARYVIAAIFAVTAYAQDRPSFEISPATTNAKIGFANPPSITPQRLSFQAALVSDVVAFAYELQPDRTEKWPQWMYDSRYDVAVTTTVPTSLPDQRRLLQQLLEQQFGLVAHRITYRIPAYFLVQGPKVNLVPSQESEEALDFCSRKLRDAFAELGPDAALVSLLRGSSPCVAPTSMSGLAGGLSSGLQVAVLDKTGISGLFDIEFGAGAPPRGVTVAMADNLPVLCIGGCKQPDYTLWLNRLGLKLELHRDTPMESLVIDHIEKPNGI